MENHTLLFEQSRADSKIFRKDVSLSEELKDLFFENVYTRLNNYVLKRHVVSMYPDFLEFARTCEARPEKEEYAAFLFYWWRLLDDTHKNPASNIFTEFHGEHFPFFKKHPIFLSWLNQAKKVTPGFYFTAGHIGGNGCTLIDLKSKEVIQVMFPSKTLPFPRKGTVVSCILLPFAEHLHLPLAIYPFEYSTREEIAPHIHHYYSELIDEKDPYMVWLQMFMSLLLVEKYTLSGEEPWKD
ncbi:hypothetical protein [Jeotgalibacillus terrae]|uniref:DUF4238 domain-containing protein n=1 Tax=Jeotgalibacillus terrae TaxID=587735 RepID=A0ABW5ZIP3_9BACL|nr:hypothetical protein [Jeotgalibacillus terrae]MBM7578786.1 hypothetical protein [Jeotgalibacillus terrae]